MKLSTVISTNVPHNIFQSFASQDFVSGFHWILADVLGIKNSQGSPAEYIVQTPDFSITCCNESGVQVILTGVSTHSLAVETLEKLLSEINRLVYFVLRHSPHEDKIQMSVSVQLDRDVTTSDGISTSLLKCKPDWISYFGSAGSFDIFYTTKVLDKSIV